MKTLAMFGLGVLSAIYLANPGFGALEFISDVIPGVGNIDEAVAAFLLMRVLVYFGIDLTGRAKPKEKAGPVIDV